MKYILVKENHFWIEIILWTHTSNKMFNSISVIYKIFSISFKAHTFQSLIIKKDYMNTGWLLAQVCSVQYSSSLALHPYRFGSFDTYVFENVKSIFSEGTHKYHPKPSY
jgi:hypothetical protein